MTDPREQAIAARLTAARNAWSQAIYNYDTHNATVGSLMRRGSELAAEADALLAHVETLTQQVAELSAENDLRRKAVANCYMMAKREIARLRNSNPSTPAVSLERWEHVLRFCESTGEKSSILRDGLPTEITDGGSL